MKHLLKSAQSFALLSALLGSSLSLNAQTPTTPGTVSEGSSLSIITGTTITASSGSTYTLTGQNDITHAGSITNTAILVGTNYADASALYIQGVGNSVSSSGEISASGGAAIALSSHSALTLTAESSSASTPALIASEGSHGIVVGAGASLTLQQNTHSKITSSAGHGIYVGAEGTAHITNGDGLSSDLNAIIETTYAPSPSRYAAIYFDDAALGGSVTNQLGGHIYADDNTDLSALYIGFARSEPEDTLINTGTIGSTTMTGSTIYFSGTARSHRVINNPLGLIQSGTGVAIHISGEDILIKNAGEISSKGSLPNSAIKIAGADATAVIENTGLIENVGSGPAILFSKLNTNTDYGKGRIINQASSQGLGIVSAEGIAIVVDSGYGKDDEKPFLINSGFIEGRTHALKIDTELFASNTGSSGGGYRIENSEDGIIQSNTKEAILIHDENVRITNHGIIRQKAISESEALGYVIKIVGNNAIVKNLESNARIIGIADSTTNSLTANAGGIYFDGENAQFENSGTVKLEGGNTIGIQFGNAAVLKNLEKGLIEVASGIAIAPDAVGVSYTLENDGSIKSVKEDGKAILFAGSIDGKNGRLTNSGEIMADAEAISYYKDSTPRGLVELTNSGSITSLSGTAIDLSALAIPVKLTNSGSIKTELAEGFAIKLSSADDTLIIEGDSNIEGKIDLSGGNDIVIARDIAKASQGEIDFGEGEDTLLVESESDLYWSVANLEKVEGESGAHVLSKDKTKIATFNGTQFHYADEILVDTLNSIHGVVNQHISYNRYLDKNQTGKQWLKLFGGIREQDDSNGLRDATHLLYGIVTGLDFRVDATSREGFLFSVGRSDLNMDANTQEVKSNILSVGYYRNYKGNRYHLSGSVVTGLVFTDTLRHINGATDQTAKGSQKSIFVSAELALFPSAHKRMIPSIQIRYSGLLQGDYSEEGSESNLLAEGRSLNLLQIRAQLSMPLKSNFAKHKLSFEGRLGYEGRMNLGGDEMIMTLLDQTFAYEINKEDSFLSTAYIGLSLNYLIFKSFSFNASLDALLADEQFIINGNFGIQLAF